MLDAQYVVQGWQHLRPTGSHFEAWEGIQREVREARAQGLSVWPAKIRSHQDERGWGPEAPEAS